MEISTLLLLLSLVTEVRTDTTVGCCFEVVDDGATQALTTMQLLQDECMKTSSEPQYKGWRKACPEGFNVTGAKEFIDENTFTFNVATWNIKDFPVSDDIPEEFGGCQSVMEIYFPYGGQAERVQQLPEALKINYPDVDVLLLQEAYRNKSMETLEDELSSLLGGDWTVRHSEHAARQPIDELPELPLISLCDRCSKRVGLSGGVRIATKHAVVDEQYHVFRSIPEGGFFDIGTSGVDQVTPKGVAYAKIRKENPNKEGKFRYFHVFNAHLQSGDSSAAKEGTLTLREVRRNQMKEAREFIDSISIFRGEPVIFGGDFNIDMAQEPEEIDWVVNELKVEHPKNTMFIDSHRKTYSKAELEKPTTVLSTFDVCNNSLFEGPSGAWEAREEEKTKHDVSETPSSFFYDTDGKMRKQGRATSCPHQWLDYIVFPKAFLQPTFKKIEAIVARPSESFTYVQAEKTITVQDVSDHYPVVSSLTYLFEDIKDAPTSCTGPRLSKPDLGMDMLYCLEEGDTEFGEIERWPDGPYSKDDCPLEDCFVSGTDCFLDQTKPIDEGMSLELKILIGVLAGIGGMIILFLVFRFCRQRRQLGLQQ